jgi:hypothetical protein
MNKVLVFAAIILLAACANRIIQFEQYSIAMNQKISADSSIYLGDEEKFQGVVWLEPILKQENAEVKSVKLILNYGIYYLCAEGFKNIWMIEPEEDGMTGEYKALDVTPDDATDVMTGISFSRYGSKENTCVKFRYNDKEIYIDRKGKLNEKCN